MIIKMGKGDCEKCQRMSSLEHSKLLEYQKDSTCNKHLNEVLKPKPYIRDSVEPVTFRNSHNQAVIKYANGGVPLSAELKRNPVRLKPYKLEDYDERLKYWLDYNNGMIKDMGRRKREVRRCLNELVAYTGVRGPLKGLTETNYVNHYHNLLWMEEHYAVNELERHNLSDVRLTIKSRTGEPKLYGIDVLGLSDGRPSIIENDFVRIHKRHDVFVDAKTNSAKYYVYEGRIKDLKRDDDVIYVAANAKEFQYRVDETVGVEFRPNLRSYQLCHRALDQLDEESLSRTLFPKKTPKQPKPQNIELEFVNKKIMNDEKQVQAIKSIVGKISGSAPYILNGPPGTGKTATLVEIIHQLFKRNSGSELPRICICAPSNQAVDVIVKRLLNLDVLEDDRTELPPGLEENVIRVYAKTADQDEDLIDYSTNGVNVEELEGKRILAMTTLTAGWLIDKGIGKNWFDYLFIDEAGQATEPNILIPIAGFMDEKCFLVLAGDQKQLGPVVTSPLAKAMHLDVSLIERLQLQGKKSSIYKNKHNRDMFARTTLNNNYRSHPQIIKIPNKLFYHGQLKAKGESGKILLASDSDWDQLSKRNNNFPILFHGVEGHQGRSGQSPSVFNKEEILVLINYINDLLGRNLSGVIIEQDHIGIISPYRTQVEMIKKFLKHRNWTGIRVGTTETFQGSEKLIMFISTARTKKRGSEFIRNERRFNVAVTRAMALLILIGHPEVLYMKSTPKNPNHWREIIDECYRFHSCKGILPLELQKN